MGDAETGYALGLESSKWDQAGAFAVGLRKIERLKGDRDEPVAKSQEYEWIAEALYNAVFDTMFKSKLETKRRCMWYFGRTRPKRDRRIPSTFDTILIRPQRHYIYFYDLSPSRPKKNFISKLNVLKPKDRQRLFDIRCASPKSRYRLMKWERKLRKKNLLRLTLEKSLPAGFFAGKVRGGVWEPGTSEKGGTNEGRSEEAGG